MQNFEPRYRGILQKIQAASGNARPTLIAVSKIQPIASIEALYQLGQRDFGENYVQEMVAKAQELDAKGLKDIRWHFIGHLQTNKVKALIPWVHSVHAVDSEKLARELAKRWKESGRPGRLPIFIEVNIDQEESKSGLKPEETPALAEKLAQIPELSLQGLMCIPAPGTPEQGRAAFRRLKELEIRCRPHTQGQLSMGMSADFEAALQEGATQIRLGTVLFGPRETAQVSG